MLYQPLIPHLHPDLMLKDVESPPHSTSLSRFSAQRYRINLSFHIFIRIPHSKISNQPIIPHLLQDSTLKDVVSVSHSASSSGFHAQRCRIPPSLGIFTRITHSKAPNQPFTAYTTCKISLNRFTSTR